MSLVQDYLRLAVELKAEEIVFDSSQKVLFRTGSKTLKQLKSTDKNLLQQSSESLISFLNENEKQSLKEQSRIHGIRVLPKIKFSFSFETDFVQGASAVSGSIRLQYPNKTVWGFSSLIADAFHRSEGLHLIVGPRKSGKTAALRELVQKVPQDKVLAIYTDDNDLQDMQVSSLVKFYSLSHLLAFGVEANVDLVVVDISSGASESAAVYEQTLSLAEQGYGVIATLTYSHLEMSLQRFLDHCQGSEASKNRRLSWVLKTILHVKLVNGIENHLCGVFELVLLNQKIRELLLNGQFQKIEEFIESTSEKTGMKTLNQSLFQSVIQRKIDIKTAFTVSPEPEKLDAMLKKAGI